MQNMGFKKMTFLMILFPAAFLVSYFVIGRLTIDSVLEHLPSFFVVFVGEGSIVFVKGLQSSNHF